MKNIITVTRPELTAEEREKRMKAITQAAVELLISVELQRKEHNK